MVYFLRHGLDDEDYVGGWSDVDLVDEGIKQVNISANKIKDMNLGIKKIISSDVKRAVTTANIIRDILKIQDIEVNKLFREQSKGNLNGILKSELDTKYTEYKEENVTIDKKYPDGESLLDLYNKIKDNLDYIMSLDDTLIVTHRGVINMLYYILNDIPLDMNKKQFSVTYASLHELDTKTKSIRKVL